MPAPTICTVTANILNMLGVATSLTRAELVCEPRKSMVSTTLDTIIISAPMRASFDAAGVATLALAETTSTNQKVVFSINWNNGDNFGSIIFDPVLIPSSASVNLADLATISRG